MKIKSIALKDFKRFTDFQVADIPASVKLVVLVGPNGSGKTSLFEAFNYLYNELRGSVQYDQNYHCKVGGSVTASWSALRQRINLEIHDVNLVEERGREERKKRFYFRTAYRHEADFSISTISKVSSILDDNRHPGYLLMGETRVSDNYQRIVAETVADIYRVGDENKTIGSVRERIIGKAKAAIANVFEGLSLNGPGDPMNDGTFLFQKGNAVDFRYKNLSGGEKAAFDLLLDFIIKSEVYNDTVYCIDEPELHMHSRLQGRLLQELYSRLPDRSQLWISTHSVGMLHQAKKLFDLDNNSVAFIDFHEQNFDEKVVLSPSKPNREFWRRIFGVAIDELADLLAPNTIVFCEGRLGADRGNRPFGFDPRAYRQIFGGTKSDVEFCALGGDKDVSTVATLITSSLSHVLPAVKFFNLLDRDDRSNQEIELAEKSGNRILSLRDLENYLWDDEILRKLCENAGKRDKAQEILDKKNSLIGGLEKMGRPTDDIKYISGDLYNFVKTTLSLNKCGNNAREFAISTLAPLVTSDTNIYKKLDADIFG
jgi:predicted ATPase